jgi:uncharacterized membrane protein YphA (DoxX/SURF4 family)
LDTPTRKSGINGIGVQSAHLRLSVSCGEFCQGACGSPNRSWCRVSHLWRVQSYWHTVYAWRWVSVLDRPLSSGRRLSVHGSCLKNFVLPHAKPIAFLVAYGELAIGIALVLGILIRPASTCGVIYMLSLLFSANYPGPHAAFWQYFGASLEHLVLALCFSAFASTNPQEILSIRTYLRRPRPV